MDSLRRKKGIQAALASALFLGMAPIFGKQAILAGFSPMGVTAFRTVLAALLLLVITFFFQKQYFYIYPVGLAGCLLAGFINGIGSICYYQALSRLDAGVGQLLYSFYPLVIAFWLVIERQPITLLTKIRLIISLPAIFLIVQTGGKATIDLLGAGLMLASSVFYAIHLMVNQRVLYEVPAPTVTLYTLISMSITVLIAYLAFDRFLPQTGTPVWPILALAFITFLSRVLLFMGVKHLGGMQTALLGLGELLIAISVSQIWLGERLTSNQWLGALLLTLSLFLVGFDHFHPERRRSSGWLSWLNPPEPKYLAPMEIPTKRIDISEGSKPTLPTSL
jgi:drug/metabolite transporter (DMT)-like permease